MPRVVRLPPLIRDAEMANHGIRKSNINRNYDSPNPRQRRRSTLTTSDAKNDSLPIDCILVYNLNNDHDDDDADADEINNNQRMRPSERRKRFEDYLVKKQGLILEHVPSHSRHIEYVKVHTPFEVLLLTAENMRMRLPIQEINEHDNRISQTVQSCYYRFKNWVKKPFRLDESLTKDDPDYYTAIYSSNIDKFKNLFDTLRGTRDLYFTSSDRSLLTYELLSRSHFDGGAGDDDDEDDDYPQKPVVRRPVLNTEIGLRKGSKRPGIDRLIAKKAYQCYFPLHIPLRDNVRKFDDEDLNDREKLQKHWATMRQCLKFQPLSLIRSYMGEKVAFYFALAGFYNQMLIPAAFVGLIIFIYGIASVFTDQPTSDICGNYGQTTYMCPTCDVSCSFYKLSDSCIYSKVSYVFDNAATVFFGIFMSLWARWCIEFWKRHQAFLQYEWDSIDFEGHLEPIRPEYENQANKHRYPRRLNPITESKEPYIPTGKRVPFFLIAAAVVLIAMAIVCATVFGTIVYRVQMDYILKKTSVKNYSSIIVTVTSAAMNLICSIILSLLYYWIAKKLTDSELHKYQSKYDDSLTIKIYLFQFVNFYSSLFYIAYFKGRFFEYPSKYGETGSGDFTEQCDPAGCFVELSIQVIIIMTGKQIINNIVEFSTATFRGFKRTCFSRDKSSQEQWEIDHDLNDFQTVTLIDEYLELVIQFGFVTLFVVAFPLAPLFALINNIIELRLDAWKFLSKYKRPIPFKASDIGIWSDIVSAISYIAVLTNAVVIAWTSEFIPKMAYRVLQSAGTDLNGYVNWTLSSFPISDYNLTGTMPTDVPPGLTYCRYRDFRASSAPYSHTSIYWNILAARLAFIVVFEHLIFFIIYLLQWLVPDVPRRIQNKIDHERFIDQRERWASRATEQNFNDAIIASEAISKMVRLPHNIPPSPIKPKRKSPNRKGPIRIRISPEDKK